MNFNNPEQPVFTAAIPEPPVQPPTNARDIGYSSVKLWSEFQMLRRLVYRSRNQHRAAFSFHRLQEVKRSGERIARLELWLKANYGETLEFAGYLNALRLQLERGKAAALKTFYYYMHYLNQALFPQLSLMVVGCVSIIHKEFSQWLKYVHLLYNSIATRLLQKPGVREQFQRCGLPLHLVEITTEPKALGKPQPQGTSNGSGKQQPGAKTASAAPPPKAKPKPGYQVKAKKNKPSSSSSSTQFTDEIDDIFNSL